MVSDEMLPEFIDHLLEQIDEDKLWQLYLAVALFEERPFAEWRADILQRPVKAEKADAVSTPVKPELTPEEAVIQADSILSRFKPF